ncbi:MAG: hypothetical protein FWF46_06235 [Oscillospiraceae bacterium]|nr:hypothetical protein [Oscillospiraceae bacterium]
MILRNVVKDINPEKLGKIIYNVFVEMFDVETFNRDIHECNIIAEKILSEIDW